MRCNYPDCGKEAATEWAQVPICEEHYDLIKKEAYRYYKKNESERPYYARIAHLTPFKGKKK